MSYFKRISLLFYLFIFLFSCREPQHKKEIIRMDLAKQTGLMEQRVSENLKKLLDYAAEKQGALNDSVRLSYLNLMDSLYESKEYEPIWSKDQQWLPLGDSLFNFIANSKNYGLFPADYHYRPLSFIRRIFMADSLTRKNALLWSRSDILLTDALFKLVKDIKQGRFKYDSVTLRTDTVLAYAVYKRVFDSVFLLKNLPAAFRSLEPEYKGYDSLKAYIPGFLSKADFKPYTYLVYPYIDSVSFFGVLEKRFHELGLLSQDTLSLDTTAFQKLLRRYQRSIGMKPTGKLTDQLVDAMNNTDWEKFKRIAVNLDRYKLLPDSLPSTHIWVNLPSFLMEVQDGDSIVFQSRVIVGEPETRTPLLTSEISNFVTFPQWTVPYSIIFREILPKIQENVDYLDKQNLMVVDENDSVYDPHLINWNKMNRNHFPYILKQKQGDDNSLGIIKFNFRNKYSVYLHDTNVRWKFGNSFRALSHGCVRVKEWKKLANFLLRNDTVRHQTDSLTAWIKKQEKHVISGFPKVPIFIRYFTCEGKGGRIKFYEDIYEEDRWLREKYFFGKTVD
jgi:murein L,D-transpeptidase YcbB/YkuD